MERARGTPDPTSDFGSLFEFLPIGAYRSGPDGTHLSANPALVRLNGCRDEAEHIRLATHAGSRWYLQEGRREAFLATLAREGRVVGFESAVRRLGDGETIWVREHAHLVRAPDGTPLYYEGTVEEITERVREREALQRSEQRLQQLVDLVPGVVYRLAIEPDGRRHYTFVSDHLREVYGVEPADLLADGTLLAQLRHPDDAERIDAHTSAAIASESPLNYEVHVQLRDGTEKWIQVVSAAAPSEGERRVRVGVLFDVTERRRAQDALQAQARLWMHALDATGDGVWDWRVQEGREFLSHQGRALYGYGDDELGDTPDALDTLTHPDDVPQMQRDREAHFSGRAPRYVNEHRIRCKDGSWKWILSRGVVIERDAQGKPLRMIGTHSDLTAARQAESLRAERDRAAAADQAKSQFLSRVSHELRTPLNAILGFGQLLQLDPGGMGASQQAWVAQVLSSGRHLLALMDDILDLSSAQTGQLAVQTEAVPLRPVLQEAWTMLAPVAQAQGVTLHDEIPGGPDCVVRADRKRLKQVVSNLLSNAIKYNVPGGWVRVSVQGTPEGCALDVADSGPGLSEAQRQRLFNPFDRLGAERGPVQGTGLGLALTRQLVEAMGGRIELTSPPGQGACFRVTLPRG